MAVLVLVRSRCYDARVLAKERPCSVLRVSEPRASRATTTNARRGRGGAPVDGVRAMVRNEPSVHGPIPSVLPAIRWSRHRGLRPLAPRLRCVPGRHGTAAFSAAFHRPHRRHWQLRTVELPVGNSDGAEQAHYEVGARSRIRRDAVHLRVGRAVRCLRRDTAGSSEAGHQAGARHRRAAQGTRRITGVVPRTARGLDGPARNLRPHIPVHKVRAGCGAKI